MKKLLSLFLVANCSGIIAMEVEIKKDLTEEEEKLLEIMSNTPGMPYVAGFVGEAPTSVPRIGMRRAENEASDKGSMIKKSFDPRAEIVKETEKMPQTISMDYQYLDKMLEEKIIELNELLLLIEQKDSLSAFKKLKEIITECNLDSGAFLGRKSFEKISAEISRQCVWCYAGEIQQGAVPSKEEMLKAYAKIALLTFENSKKNNARYLNIE